MYIEDILSLILDHFHEHIQFASANQRILFVLKKIRFIRKTICGFF